jgi:hypothetical protein
MSDAQQHKLNSVLSAQCKSAPIYIDVSPVFLPDEQLAMIKQWQRRLQSQEDSIPLHKRCSHLHVL